MALCSITRCTNISCRAISHIIGRTDRISTGAQRGIRTTVTRLGCVPGHITRRLTNGRSLLVNITASDLTLRTPSRVITTVGSHTSRLNTDIIISVMRQDNIRTYGTTIRGLLTRHIDKLVVGCPLSSRSTVTIRTTYAGIPTLFLSISSRAPVGDVVFSRRSNAQLNIRRLITLNRRRVTLLTNPLDSISTHLHLTN